MKTKNSNVRQAIIDTAETLFKKQGFRRTALADIGRAMSKTRTAVYKHFKSKEDLFIAGIAYGAQTLFDDLHKIAKRDTTALNKIKMFCKTKFSFIKHKQLQSVDFHKDIANNPILKLELQNIVSSPEIEIMKDIILSGVRSGEFKKMEPRQVRMISYIFYTATDSIIQELFEGNNLNKFSSATKVLEDMLISSLIK